ncbi:MAG: hypothetical protein U0T81_12960 [Saprospiraceae bacterium]
MDDAIHVIEAKKLEDAPLGYYQELPITKKGQDDLGHLSNGITYSSTYQVQIQYQYDKGIGSHSAD